MFWGGGPHQLEVALVLVRWTHSLLHGPSSDPPAQTLPSHPHAPRSWLTGAPAKGAWSQFSCQERLRLRRKSWKKGWLRLKTEKPTMLTRWSTTSSSCSRENSCGREKPVSSTSDLDSVVTSTLRSTGTSYVISTLCKTPYFRYMYVCMYIGTYVSLLMRPELHVFICI